MIGVTILGSNSAIPANGRHPTSQIVQVADHHFLMDCGEGTQMQMNLYKIKRNKINHIFISHLHGDHYFGLIGLLNSFALNNRTENLHIYSPAGLEQIIQLQLDCANSSLPYPCHFHLLEEEGILLDEKNVTISCFKVKHRIACFGFVFREKINPRKIIQAEVAKYKIPFSFYEKLQKGDNFITENNEVIKNEWLTTPSRLPKSYAFCADTCYFEEIFDKIRDVDLIYYEATYLSNLEEKARSRFHSTSKQAGMVAKNSGAKRLLIGHFSSMYESPEQHRQEACEVFPDTEIATEGSCFFV